MEKSTVLLSLEKPAKKKITADEEEPLLKENPDRYVLFPIQN